MGLEYQRVEIKNTGSTQDADTNNRRCYVSLVQKEDIISLKANLRRGYSGDRRLPLLQRKFVKDL